MIAAQREAIEGLVLRLDQTAAQARLIGHALDHMTDGGDALSALIGIEQSLIGIAGQLDAITTA